jgi:hypothetical protein
MTQDGDARVAGTVTALRRPPVRHGGYLGGAYREGWARILGCLVAAMGGQS